MADYTIPHISSLKSSPSAFFTRPPFSSEIERRRRYNLTRALAHTLDRVNVLGDDGDYGHTGCVNALSWAQDGDILLSASDDTTVRIWGIDSRNNVQEYPFVCRSTIDTGHRANIFSAKMLPLSSRIATAAGDGQVRILDVSAALSIRAGYGDTQTEFSSSQSCIRVIRCHHDSVKKIITEGSPDLFLSVSEDGSVRQHDLRTSHSCGAESCPAPLVDIGHELSALSLSPLVPYQFVVAGEGSYGYLFDRRYLRRTIEHDWGMVPQAGKEPTTCVRKFGRERSSSDKRVRRDHITGARMSKSNGHEVLFSYSGDGVYLFSTKDEPKVNEDFFRGSQSPLHAEVRFYYNEIIPDISPREVRTEGADESGEQDRTPQRAVLSLFDHLVSSSHEVDPRPDVPIVMPRRRYTGARNVMTVKDVNFLGPDDEWVVSGSDDGNLFVWNKDSSTLQGIYEGDSSVVNVIEGHPHLPLLAVSGIDTTVKLFASTGLPSVFSRMDNAEQIINANRRLGSTRFRRYDISALLQEDPDSMGSEGIPTRVTECIGQ
ncbi:WD40-repeat-containing domain protein [Gymnopilus junonius]|uniref:WD40-repeat-containing domain protein n=1 Tax=Gymnopilus junonius TaxID=109634 RepID=A0A9P5P336_GYMJU|nr:WD40-repeat-containing domain protein [Gymnopilus junonius]